MFHLFTVGPQITIQIFLLYTLTISFSLPVAVHFNAPHTVWTLSDWIPSHLWELCSVSYIFQGHSHMKALFPDKFFFYFSVLNSFRYFDTSSRSFSIYTLEIDKFPDKDLFLSSSVSLFHRFYVCTSLWLCLIMWNNEIRDDS